MVLCKYNLQARCTKGDLCQYEHNRSTVPSLSKRTAGQGIGTAGKPKVCLPDASPVPPCRFFQSGRCLKGSGCTFAHIIPSHSPAEGLKPQPVIPSPQDSRSQVLCKFYVHGECTNGNSCPYSHSDAAVIVSSQEERDKYKDETDHDNFSRLFSGVVAQFSDGGLVSKILFPWESSAVRLNGLPAKSTPFSVAALLGDIGFQVPPGSIRTWKSSDALTTNAHINIEDATFSRDICVRLSGAARPSLHAFQAPPILPSTTTTRRLGCKKVVISWYKPTRSVWLNFGSKDVARRVSAGFNEGRNMVLGQEIKASAPQTSEPLNGWSHITPTHRNRVPWTVLLKRVPAVATQSQIANSLPPADRPRHIELSKTNYPTDENTVSVSVRSLLTSIGPVNFEMSSATHGRRIRATALFEEEDDAREAVRILHDKPQEFLNQGKLMAQLVSSSKFKISKAIYDSVKIQLDAQHSLFDERHVKFKAFPDTVAERFVVLKIEGENAEHVKAATGAVETILTGLIIKSSDVPLWGPALAHVATHQRLKQLQREHGIVLSPDKSKRLLRFFGSPAKYKQVSEALVAYFEEGLNEPQIIQLNDQQFAWACRGGFTQIVRALDQQVASFDIASNPKRIIITGTYEQYRCALDIMEGKKVRQPDGNEAEREECVICYTEAEDPVEMQCGHRYCLECFATMCTSTASGDREIAIHCEGDMGGCDRVIGLLELQKLLSSAALEEVLEASFNRHIRCRPDRFRCCPTPDCGNVFRTTGTAKRHTCTGCFTVVCTVCYNQHGFMTCAEYKYLESGGYAAFEKLKKEMQIKDCPKCSTPMEKTDGCNHMTCRGCGTHICWVCMKTFTASGPCYDHMNKAHGGIGLGGIEDAW